MSPVALIAGPVPVFATDRIAFESEPESASGAATANGFALVPSPVKVLLRETDERPELVLSIVIVFPEGVIVMFDPAWSVTPSDNPLRLFTTCPVAIF